MQSDPRSLMPGNKNCSAFAAISPQSARTVLRIAVLMMVLLAAVSLSPWACGFADKPSRGAGDVDLYRAEIQRIAAGESYYQAASKELHARGYPTRSVFNWRTPLPMWLLGKLPSEMLGRVIIGALAVAALLLSVFLLGRETNARAAFLGGLMMIGGLMPCWLEQIYVMPVVWAGVLILLSICAYAIGRPGWGVICGLASLFVRELAAPVFDRLLNLGTARTAVARSHGLADRIGGIWVVLFVACASGDGARGSDRSCMPAVGCSSAVPHS